MNGNVFVMFFSFCIFFDILGAFIKATESIYPVIYYNCNSCIVCVKIRQTCINSCLHLKQFDDFSIIFFLLVYSESSKQKQTNKQKTIWISTQWFASKILYVWRVNMATIYLYNYEMDEYGPSNEWLHMATYTTSCNERVDESVNERTELNWNRLNQLDTYIA